MSLQNTQKIDFQKILHHIENFATSEIGKEEIRRTYPLESAKLAQKSFLEISECKSLLSIGKRPFAQSLDLFAPWYERLRKGAILKILELRDVRHFCTELVVLKECLLELPHLENYQYLFDVKNSLFEAEEPLSVIDQLMTAAGEIRTDASDILYKLYKEKIEAERNVQNTLDKIVKAHNMERVLQEKFVTNREGRWVLPIKSGMQHSLEGIIHDASQTKQTVFMEPQEVVTINNRIRRIEIEIQEEIERLLKETSKYLSQHLIGMADSKVTLQKIDVRLSQAQFAIITNSVECGFNSTYMYLPNLRHPILTYNENDVEPHKKSVVANDVKLQQGENILLLSGPNAGGKTVLLKSIGLAAHMARCGLLICTDEGASLPFFQNLFISVGDAQNVDENLSTFAAHLKELTNAVNQAKNSDLILIDEICGATDPEEGSALAKAYIENFASKKCFGIITSHLSPLRDSWPDQSGVVAGSMEYDDVVGNPTYHLVMGVAGRSHAMKTAKRIGTPDFILKRAQELMSPHSKLREQKMEELESLREETQSLREKLRKDLHEAHQTKQKYTELVDKFRRERNSWMDATILKTNKRIDQLIDEARENRLRNQNKGLSELKAELPQIIKSRPSEEKRITSLDEFTKAFPPGAKVFVPSLGQDAIIQGAANNKGEIPVLAHSMRVQIHWEKLLPPQKATNPIFDIARRSNAASSAQIHTSERTIDVRGQFVEDALLELERALDQATLNHESRIKIIHGHGTDSLKKAIRSFLSRSPYVKKWQAGQNRESGSGDMPSGNDGITWVEI